MKYLIQTVETYRVDKEDEAKRMIEEAKSDNHFILKKYSSEYKEKKQKGEIINTYYKVTLTKAFTDEKEPEFRTEISYANDIENAF